MKVYRIMFNDNAIFLWLN